MMRLPTLLLALLLAADTQAANLGSWAIDDGLTFSAVTHSPTTGAAADADSVPTYRVYEDETGTAILTGSMALLDDANTTGFYSEQITLSAANGLERGKSYTVVISATVAGVAGTKTHNFQIGAATDVVYVSNDSTAADNLESAADNYSATRGLAGTALPNAAADAAGGLPVSDAGGLDMDAVSSRVTTGIPNATAGSSGGLLIAGTNAAAVSITGGLTVSNASGTALTLTSSGGDGHGLSADGDGGGHGVNIVSGSTGNGVSVHAPANVAIYASSSTTDAFALGGGGGVDFRLESATNSNVGGLLDAVLTDTADMQPKLGTPSVDLSADLAANKAAIDGIEAGTTQPRINYPATWQLKLSNRNDGTYKATKPVRLRPGTVDTSVAVDCTPLFGRSVRVETVGSPTVSGGSITATALGPRDEEAMIQLAGTATAGETQTVSFTVTAENGDSEEVVVDLRVFAD